MENSNTSCPNARDVVIFGKNVQSHKAVFFHPSCGSWSCEYCWQENRDKWLHIAMRGTLELQERGSMMRFITLTGRGYFTPQSSIYFMRRNWSGLLKRVKYLNDKWADVTGTEWAYLLIPERHQSGVAHWHIIASTWLDRRKFWKDIAYECGFGFMAEVSEIDDSLQAGLYVSKYMTKDAGGLAWPKNFRRARVSANWPRPDENIPSDWYYRAIPPQQLDSEKQYLLDSGFEVIDKT